uniref:Uncharacterized protein TCIL3000_11_1790 n=1 Tax=Trypanosoma congolense (strain IL3000) TaxID=1068625 RepID=G0UZH7_TRYCI|nr:unnamed protein product [Trypanosoma congolense IL3000]
MFLADIEDVHSFRTEVGVAKVFASAANSTSPHERPVVQLRIIQPLVQDGSQPPGDEWNRRDRDVILLCLDRAVGRVYPPLDPLQYTQTPAEFLVEEGLKVVRLQVIPTAQLFPHPLAPHGVEGCTALADDAPQAERPQMGGYAVESGLSGGGAASDASSVVRKRWKKGAWLAARFFNEGSWRPAGVLHGKTGAVSMRFSNVIDAAENDKGKRLLHVDVGGMEFVGVISAVTSRYAYVAVPHVCEGDGTPKWVLVTRVSVPGTLDGLANKATLKRQRGSDGRDRQAQTFVHEREVMSHDANALKVLDIDKRVVVTLRAHKVFCTWNRTDSQIPEVLSLFFDDVSTVAGGVALTTPRGEGTEAALVSHCNSYNDLLDIVKMSCERFNHGYAKYEGATSNSAAERLFSALTDTVSVRPVDYGGTRGGGGRRRMQPPVTISSPRDIPSLFEGPCVEFKAKVGTWKHGDPEEADDMFSQFNGSTEFSGANDKRDPLQRRGLMNVERIRHTIAAMATTLGGVLLVGVRDDGVVVGHPPEALRDLRLTGFCPAMAKGSVQLTTMRAVTSDTPAALPKEWWKNKGQKSNQQVVHENQKDYVVTVIAVSRGQAPFYAVSRNSVPYIRGLASTVPLHVVSAARRISSVLS